jgi:hypothetical protein
VAILPAFIVVDWTYAVNFPSDLAGVHPPHHAVGVEFVTWLRVNANGYIAVRM